MKSELIRDLESADQRTIDLQSEIEKREVRLRQIDDKLEVAKNDHGNIMQHNNALLQEKHLVQD